MADFPVALRFSMLSATDVIICESAMTAEPKIYLFLE